MRSRRQPPVDDFEDTFEDSFRHMGTRDHSEPITDFVAKIDAKCDQEQHCDVYLE